MKQYSNFHFLASLLKIVKGFPLFLLVGSIIFSLSAGIFDVKLADTLGKVTDNGSDGLIYELGLLYLYSRVARLFSSLSLIKGSSLAGFKTSAAIFKGIQARSEENQRNDSKYITLLTRNIDYLVNRLYTPIFLLIGNILSSTYLFWAAFDDLKAHFLTLDLTHIGLIFSAVATVYGIRILRKKGKTEGKKYRELMLNSTSIAKDLTSVLDEIKVSGSSGYMEKIHTDNERKLRNTESNIAIIPSINSFTLEITALAIFAIIANNLNLSMLLPLAYIGLRLMPQLNIITSSYLRISNIMPTIKICQPYLVSKIDTHSKRSYWAENSTVESNPRFRTISVPSFTVRINEQNNIFNYPRTYFYSGELNLITGRSGTGKTTFIESLLGLKSIHDQTNNIEALTVNIEDDSNVEATCPLAYLRHYIAYCPQIPRIIKGSIKENLSISTFKVDSEKVLLQMSDLGLSHLTDVTDCNTLSGGEKKRLTLLRAVLLDRPIKIFDEPTSGLSSADIEIVLSFLQKASKSAIVIIVTHQPRLIKAGISAVHLK